MSTSGVLDTIDSLLSSVTDPTPQAVIRGEPLTINATPTFSFWIADQSEDFETLGDRSTNVTFLIRCYWHLQQPQDLKEALELEVYNAIVNIKKKLASDALLSGNCQYSLPGTATTGYIEMSGNTFKIVTIPFVVSVYSESTITP